jgi:uncharacterized membrane protein YeiH
VLRRDLYARVSLATGVLYMGLMHVGASPEIATAITIGVGFSLRLLALCDRAAGIAGGPQFV